MLEQMSSREKFLLCLLVLVAITFIIVRFILVPQAKAYIAVSNDLKQARAQLRDNLKLVSSLEQEEKAVQEVQQNLEILKPYFCTEMQDGMALARLGLEAEKQKVAITLFQPQPAVEKEHYVELPINFGIRGPYKNVVNYLACIEDAGNMLNLSEIRMLTVQPCSPRANEEQKTGAVMAKFTLVVFGSKTPESKIKVQETPMPQAAPAER